jgi:hypothetical protein
MTDFDPETRRRFAAVEADWDAAVAEARRSATASVSYVRSDVYHAATALNGDRFDVVHTGKGALCHLPDLSRWADVVAGLLRPRRSAPRRRVPSAAGLARPGPAEAAPAQAAPAQAGPARP